LLTVENLRGNVGLAMSSGGGSLLSRVRRLAMPSKQGQLNAGWWLASMVSIATVAIIATSLWVSTSRLTAAESDDDWGQSVNGLQIRAVPVSAEMNDDAVDLSKVVAKTKSQQQLAFAVELKNITDKPIKILDARYGEGYGDSKGKANSDWSAQFLFTIDYYDKSRKLIAKWSTTTRLCQVQWLWSYNPVKAVKLYCGMQNGSVFCNSGSIVESSPQ
jgi:hypothetical protein